MRDSHYNTEFQALGMSWLGIESNLRYTTVSEAKALTTWPLEWSEYDQVFSLVKPIQWIRRDPNKFPTVPLKCSDHVIPESKMRMIIYLFNLLQNQWNTEHSDIYAILNYFPDHVRKEKTESVEELGCYTVLGIFWWPFGFLTVSWNEFLF